MKNFSIRLKILVIVLGFFSLILAAFAVYSKATTTNYRQLRIGEVSGIIAFESERVGKVIAEMERNAVDLALAGRQYFLAGGYPAGLGIAISVENFSAFTTAVGGGIWFEPFAFDPERRRVCYYAFFDTSTGTVRHDPDFQTAAYDYHTQIWYTSIAAGLNGIFDTIWTAPYYDDAGTNAFMTTVGSGIYDNTGRFVGMSTVDWEIQSMVDRLTSIKPTEGSFVLVASPKDNYIISNTYRSEYTMTGETLRNLSWYRDLHFTGGETVDIGHFTAGGEEYISFSRLLDNGWLFSVQIPAREIFAEIETRNNRFTVIIAVSFFMLLALTAFLLSQLINRPLWKLTSSVAELGSGNLDKQIDIYSKDEIGTLAAAFNKMIVDLKESIKQRELERAKKERNDAELNVATQIQVSMLPHTFPNHAEFEIYAMMQPAREVGGDFYDFFQIDEHTLAVVIADVSGKGVPAALFMVIARTLIKNTALSGKRPEVVFGIINKMLCETNDAGMFVTAFLGYLDIPTGKFTYVNAGHNPPLLRRSGGRFDWMQLDAGFVLACMEEFKYSQYEITLNAGDGLLLYTDGITEAVNNENEMFSNQRLLDIANEYIDLPLKEFSMSIKNEVYKFSQGAEQADDITMLALRYNPKRFLQVEADNELFIEAKPENINTVMDFVNEWINSCPAKIQNQIGIAVDEIFSNIARYAYHPEIGDILVRIAADEENITLEFEDKGMVYNPLSAKTPDITLSVEEREIGGLGLFIVKNIMDSVEYRREGNKNILTIKKKVN